jgi:hypothetical protein
MEYDRKCSPMQILVDNAAAVFVGLERKPERVESGRPSSHSQVQYEAYRCAGCSVIPEEKATVAHPQGEFRHAIAQR